MALSRCPSAISILAILASEERVRSIVADPTILDLIAKEDRALRADLALLRELRGAAIAWHFAPIEDLAAAKYHEERLTKAIEACADALPSVLDVNQ